MTRPTDDIVELGFYEFPSGARIQLRAGYRKWGDLGGRDVVLLLPGATGSRNWADSYIGKDRAFDTERFCFISIDPLGGGASSKPSDALGPDFPQYSVSDMISMQQRLLSKLKISMPFAVVGMSVGGMMALEWGRIGTGRTVSWISGPRVNGSARVMAETIAQVIALDPVFSNGHYKRQPIAGMSAAAGVYLPLLYGPSYLSDLNDAELADAASALPDNWLSNWDALDLIYRYRAATKFNYADVTDGDIAAAAAQIRCPALLLPSATDQLVSVNEVRSFSESLPLGHCEAIETQLGHGAALAKPGTSEHDKFCQFTKEFLNR